MFRNPNPAQKPLRTITLEEHYATPSYMDGPGREIKQLAASAKDHPMVAAAFGKLVDNLCDIGEKRIAEMDAAGITMQVISLTAPGTEQVEPAEALALAKSCNDSVAESVKRFPDRIGGFAALPTGSPDQAADELERAVKQLGFKGALINGHTRGRYLDDKFFWPIFERAESLKVPVYLHPTIPVKAVCDVYYTGNFSREVTAIFQQAGWGWHIETAIHAIRIILGGVFDKYPNLQLIVGHLGESLPFMIPRLELTMPQQVTKLGRPIGEYFRSNIHYTFSGFNYLPAFLDLLLEVGVDRIMFSADYPYASMPQARAFLDQIPVSPDDRERIAHGNAEKLMQL
jgi:uncharacterized protein